MHRRESVVYSFLVANTSTTVLQYNVEENNGMDLHGPVSSKYPSHMRCSKGAVLSADASFTELGKKDPPPRNRRYRRYHRNE